LGMTLAALGSRAGLAILELEALRREVESLLSGVDVPGRGL